MRPELPAAISAYFDALNTGRAGDASRQFRPDGVVRDESRTHVGHEAIRGWAEDALKRYRMKSQVLEFTAEGEGCIVKARVSGDFAGSPLDFTYRFELANDGVKMLEIGL
ncbi:nuclear transport factor 2 family protein [Brevundimonas faecalis]|uniref:nuclear transport factor 2 family protein n=1 Tax=Brevundimonas faecalis TaxID=947378 RepID=UPI00361B69CB